MKTIFTLILSLFLSLAFGQNTAQKKCAMCKQESTNAILVTYKHTAIKTDFPKPFVYQFKTQLYINDTVTQYNFYRKTKIVRNKNYQTKIGTYRYINNYYYPKKIMEELRILDKGKLKASWKPNYNWKITDETKTIKGFFVKKAVAESIEVPKDDPAYYGKVYAWFTEEIPIPAGPDRYVGLPGLILEIEYEKSTKKTVIESINFKPDYKLKKIDDGIEVPDKDDLIYYFHKNKKFIRKLLNSK